MKWKVVSGAQVKLFSTRKAQYLAQALTLGVTNASGPGIPQPNFVSRNEQRDITALGRSLVIFSFGNVAYGFFIQFAECLPWRAGSCFRADALQSKVASLDFEFDLAVYAFCVNCAFNSVYDSRRPVYARFPLTIRKQKQILASEERLYSLFAENLGKCAKSVRQTRNNPFSLFSRINKRALYSIVREMFRFT